MKHFSKILGIWAIVLIMVASNQAFAFAATTYHTTGKLKNGLYAVTQTVPGSTKDDTSEYRLSVLIEKGKVSLVQFGTYTQNMRYAKTFANAITDSKKKAQLLATCAEQDYYQTQANKLKDGAKVKKYKKAVNGNMYKGFQALWKKAIKKAGGKVVVSK